MDIIIVGIGRVGKQLIQELSLENHNVTAIDLSEKKIDKIVETYDVQGITGSGILIDDLNSADVKNCDLFISVTPYDQDNILACLIANRLGAKDTVARVRNPDFLVQFEFMREELGITMMINPDYSTAREIFRLIQFPKAMNVDTFSNGRIDMAEIKIKKESPLCNMKIANIPPKYSKDLLICAVCRGEEVFIPKGDFVIKAGDRIHVTGSHDQLGKISKIVSGQKDKNIKDVMLIGASKIAIYLANMLAEADKNVVVVERREEKCKKMIDHCKSASVIYSDANDHDILTEEGIENMDAVVTLTNADETNILVSMFADSVGVDKIITKVSDPNLSYLVTKLNNSAAVSTAEATSDLLVQYVRAKKSRNSAQMKTLYKLVGGKIEAAEFTADDYFKHLGKPISSIRVKDNILIAAVNRGDKIFFPSGNDTIEKDDVVIVVSKGYALSTLNDIVK